MPYFNCSIVDDSSIGDVSENENSQNTDDINVCNGEENPGTNDSDKTNQNSDDVVKEKCIVSKESSGSSSTDKKSQDDMPTVVGNVENSQINSSSHQ